MDRIEPATLVPVILAAPAWAKLGITMPKDQLRHAAAVALAEAIVAGLERPWASDDQLTLPLPL